MKKYKTGERGITLLITLLLMGVLLGVSASLLNLTLKQYQLAGIALSSETAFQAANAGLECILYHDFSAGDPFAVSDDGMGQLPETDVSCMEDSSDDLEGGNNSNAGNQSGQVESGEEQRFSFTWSGVCSEVSIYKFSNADTPENVIVNGRNMRQDLVNNSTGAPVPDGLGDPCPAGSVCTVVQARGYNVPCDDIGSNPRVVEREYTQVY